MRDSRIREPGLRIRRPAERNRLDEDLSALGRERNRLEVPGVCIEARRDRGGLFRDLRVEFLERLSGGLDVVLRALHVALFLVGAPHAARRGGGATECTGADRLTPEERAEDGG